MKARSSKKQLLLLLGRIALKSSTVFQFVWAPALAYSQWHEAVPTHEIPLVGEASGGQLSLIWVNDQAPPYIKVETTAGDGGQAVAERLRVAAISSPDIDLSSTNSSIVVPSLANRGLIALGGTETGFGIPSTPKSVSASYSAISNGVEICWEGVENWDLLIVRYLGRPVAGIRDSIASVIIPHAKLGSFFNPLVTQAQFHLVAYNGDVPSNAAGIMMRNTYQQDVTLIPFTCGVWPNWTKWNLPGQEGVAARQADRDPIPSPGKGGTGHRSYAQFAPFYQGMSADVSSYCGGTYRRFLGLEPGATYKVAARLNTFGQEASTNWAYSVHAAHSAPDNSLLTPQQLAGTAPLPDGSQAATAGRIGAFGESNTTEGFWIECATDGTCPGREIDNIQLPAGVTSLTVWVRLTGTNTVVDDVGIDWVSIEKLP